MKTHELRICILGATGLVGRELVALAERAWPAAELVLYASRDQEITLGAKRYAVSAAPRLEEATAPRGELAFVALDDEHSKRYVPRLLHLGYRVVDKSNTYRGDPRVPLVAAGVNSADVTDAVRLVANPNCTTIPLTLALAPLDRTFGLLSASVSTYQAVGGAGIAVLDEFLTASQRGYGDPDRVGAKFDPNGYAGNVVPHNGGTDESGFSSEERKLVFESRKIMKRPELAIGAQCCRVAVAVGHFENAWVSFAKSPSIEAIDEILADTRRAPFVRYFRGATGEGLSAISAARDRDYTLVGRVRHDPRDPERRTVCLSIVADNLRLGAATNAIRIASRWQRSLDASLQS